MAAAVVVLSVICIVLLYLLIKEKISIRKVVRELENRSAGDSYMPLPLVIPDKDIEEMLAAMNRYIDQHQTKLSYYVNRETDFRKQIANISHDLRTPLTSIIGYVQLIQKNNDSGMNTERNAEYLAIVAKKAQLLKSLIGQFYDLSRLESDEYDLHMERLEVKTLVAQAMADYYNEFEQAGLSVDVHMPEDKVYIIADGKGMMRIFHNLLQNVLKHGKEKLVVSICLQEKEVHICFENNAETLTENEVEHLFDRFYTADHMRTGQNTGLGLAIVKSLAEHMGQKINAAYENGQLKINLTINSDTPHR